MIERFRELLLEVHKKSMHDQQDMLHETLDNRTGEMEQTDDIIVIGFRPL